MIKASLFLNQKQFYNSTIMQHLFQEDFEQNLSEFINYQKDLTNKKTRHERKVQKIEKLKHDLNDPEMKKQRHQIRRAQEKNKLQKQLAGMTEQQARIYLDGKKQKKKLAKQKILKAIKDGQQIFIDVVYQKSMNEKENKSLAIQIQLIMKSIRHIEEPPGIRLCSVGGVVQKQLQKMNYHFWTLESHKEDIVEVASKMGKKLIYLSPDAPQPLQSVEIGTAYVIGGLVDRTVIKNASYNRATQLNIEARHLPIRQFMKNRSCLNLDHVVMILCKFKECGDWKQAFEFGAPKRWKKGENEHGIRKISKEEESEEQDQIKQEQKNQGYKGNIEEKLQQK